LATSALSVQKFPFLEGTPYTSATSASRSCNEIIVEELDPQAQRVRVSTDLSKTVAQSNTGLVLFIIDACRDRADVPLTKGAAKWGDPARIARPDEPRFIRFFGCASNEVCQFVSAPNSAPLSSLFTKALVDSIAVGSAVSLEELQSKVETRCADLLANNPHLAAQTPRLSYGELSVEKRRILRQPIFDPIGRAALQSVWSEFDPNKFHCLVILSEYEKGTSPDWGLTELVRDAVAGETGDRIWTSFIAAGDNVRLVSGKQRRLPAVLEPSAICFGSFSVIDAFSSGESLDRAVRVIVEADLAVFDVTGFEPGIMLLLGIRSACRRWLSVCSHGAGWKEGQPLDLPFNLQYLNINSHTPRDTRVGADPVVERFVQRVETGFLQVSKQPNYLDLPGFDALRQLGSNYSASSTIDQSERILVLCSYSERFFSNWRFVSSRLKRVLWEKKKYSPQIERIIDYGTPQLIQQGLYEQIRRTAACVVDWSEFSASVFLELGARLAVSEWGVIQLIDERYLPDAENASKLLQIDQMRRLLTPISYRYRDEALDAFEKVADAILQRNPNLDGDVEYNRVYRALLSVVESVQAAQLPVVLELKRRADALHNPQQSRFGAPQILFSGSRVTKQDSERAALELRIAAWLYLEHRVGMLKLKVDAEMLQMYRDLGRSASDALYDIGDDESIALAINIEERLRQGE
jgi:hypothetical protein